MILCELAIIEATFHLFPSTAHPISSWLSICYSLTKNSSFADLHMLACLYSAQGKTTEARQLFLDAMAAGYQAEPNPAVWFGFGSMYEQLGLDEAAIGAYRRVDAPDRPVSPIDTYNLAQIRLTNLHGDETHP